MANAATAADTPMLPAGSGMSHGRQAALSGEGAAGHMFGVRFRGRRGRGRASQATPQTAHPLQSTHSHTPHHRSHRPNPPAVMTPKQKANILSEALPYIQAYHGKTVVVRFGGIAMADDGLKSGFARDIALLRLIGIKPVIVHGGGWRIDDLMRQMGIESRRRNGVRITDERTLTVVEMALGEINQELTGLINKHGARAVGLDGQDGRFIHARPLSRDSADGASAEDL